MSENPSIEKAAIENAAIENPWTEAESTAYRDISRYAVPERERQLAVMAALAQAARADGPVLDLCCGEGLLTEALFRAMPEARLLAYDGSESMLAATRGRVASSRRLVTRRIDLGAEDWRAFETPLRAALSSLAVHHLDAAGKRRLFADLFAALAPGGVFVLADVIQPAAPMGAEIAARLWDEETERRALALDGTRNGFEAFQRADWNHFRHETLDPMDKPSTLLEHFDWLREAGFIQIDVHWMSAGQMILSAWKP